MRMQIETHPKETKFFLEADTPLDNVTIMKVVGRIKKPVRAFGAIRELTGLAWGWICIPNNKKVSTYDLLRFENENQKS